MRPEISVLMTIHNDFSLFPIALNSLKIQKCENWELLILDNSDNNPDSWNIIMQQVLIDSRIKAWKSPGYNGALSVGWPKGASILLEKAEGEYVTFLSADDFLDESAFLFIHECINKERPDVIWVGNTFVEHVDNTFRLLDYTIPDYHVFKDDKLFEVYYVLNNTYFNSMFHYIRRDFMEENKINFFEPYYADYVSMTAALAYAKKTVTLDQAVYHLTRNTSQTMGAYTYGFYDKFGKQWEIMRNLLLKEQCQDPELFHYVLYRIYRNFNSNYQLMLSGAPCRDDYMNPIPVTENLIKEQMIGMAHNENVMEMLDLLKEIDSN